MSLFFSDDDEHLIEVGSDPVVSPTGNFSLRWADGIVGDRCKLVFDSPEGRYWARELPPGTLSAAVSDYGFSVVSHISFGNDRVSRIYVFGTYGDIGKQIYHTRSFSRVGLTSDQQYAWAYSSRPRGIPGAENILMIFGVDPDSKPVLIKNNEVYNIVCIVMGADRISIYFSDDSFAVFDLKGNLMPEANPVPPRPPSIPLEYQPPPQGGDKTKPESEQKKPLISGAGCIASLFAALLIIIMLASC